MSAPPAALSFLARAVFRIGAGLAVQVFFRRVEVEGRERVPGGPVLVVANHVNGLLDPLLVTVALGRPLTLTAKSTLASGRVLAPLLRSIGVVLFHRRQDRREGADLRANVSTLETCRRLLRRGAALCVFPEGVSHSEPALQPFRTGAARIALDYVDLDGDAGWVRILPVGLHYEAKGRFRSAARVGVGEPIAVGAWHHAHPAAGPRELTALVEGRVGELTLNFASRSDVELFDWAAEVLEAPDEPLPLGDEDRGALGARMRLVRRLQAGRRELEPLRRVELEALEQDLRSHRRRLKRLGVDPGEVRLPIHAGRALVFVVRESAVVALGLPVAAWGALNHIVPWLAARAAASSARDADQVATRAVAVGLPSLVVAWVAQTAAVGWLASWPAAAIYAATLPFTGAFALLYGERLGQAARRARTFLLFLARPDVQRRLRADGDGLVQRLASFGRDLEATPAAAVLWRDP